ncbi:MAG TPA: hypothetical protein VI277_02600 [Candidatus Limnocylindria bacterium]
MRIRGGGTLAVVAAALLSACQPAGVATPSPSTAASSSADTTSSASPTAAATIEPTQTATAAPAAGWQEGGSFGAEGTIEHAESAVRTADGFIAVGTWYGVAAMPHSGPVPQEGRVWHSADGRSWEDVTPEATFADAGLRHVYVADDGALIVLGMLHEASEDAIPMAWESANGRDWAQTSIGLTGHWTVERLAHGGGGYLAQIVVAPDIYSEFERGLWFSVDGRSWERVWAESFGSEIGERIIDIGAGDDGFAATGTRGEDIEPFVIASSDGREWFEATAPPAESGPIAERGGDWVAVGTSVVSVPRPTEATVWSSANGLLWSETGSVPLYPVEPGSGDEGCSDLVVDLHSAGPWLIANATAGYALCAEGRIRTYGSQSLSRDGRSWDVLPFPPFAFDEAGAARGSQVNGAFVEGDVLILIGHASSRATFWFNEAP